jgi:hypothetical protein
MNNHSLIRKLALSNKYQNLFTSAKDFGSIKIFENNTDLTKIQNLFLNYLYFYDSLYRDLVTEKISKHLMDCELYEDSYVIWKKEKMKNLDKKEDKSSNVKLVTSNEIIFPKRDLKE